MPPKPQSLARGDAGTASSRNWRRGWGACLAAATTGSNLGCAGEESTSGRTASSSGGAAGVKGEDGTAGKAALSFWGTGGDNTAADGSSGVGNDSDGGEGCGDVRSVASCVAVSFDKASSAAAPVTPFVAYSSWIEEVSVIAVPSLSKLVEGASFRRRHETAEAPERPTFAFRASMTAEGKIVASCTSSRAWREALVVQTRSSGTCIRRESRDVSLPPRAFSVLHLPKGGQILAR